MAKKKSEKKAKTHQQLLAAVVENEGSEERVAKKIGCSQQSINAWIKGSWLPRMAVQKKMKELYKIPVPWKKAEAEAHV